MMHKSTFLLASFLSLAVLARGGGSVVGNGAGLVENNFQYAYSTLGTLVRNCLQAQDCGMTEKESRILQSMQMVLSVNSSRSDRLVFVSEKENPGFFETGPGQRHRVAKTGLTAQTQIFINVDALYADNGKPLLDLPTIISILAHEVGHQAGEENHAILDILGSKLRQSLERKMIRHEMKLQDKDKSVEVMIINHSVPLRSAEILMTWAEAGSRSVTGDLVDHLKCANEGSVMSGFEFRNGHFVILEGSTGDNLDLGFSLWAYLSCYSSARGSVESEKFQLRFRINQSLRFQFLDRVRIP